MAEAAAHHEKMEDFVGTEVLMPAVKNRKFQCVDHTADGVDDALDEREEYGRDDW